MGVGGGDNSGYSPDFSCRPPRRVLLDMSFFGGAEKLVSRQAYRIASN